VNDAEFKKEIARLNKRLELLRLARKGDVNIKKVYVRAYKVRAHTVKAHVRVFYYKHVNKQK
jgi:hypothetical protein